MGATGELYFALMNVLQMFPLKKWLMTGQGNFKSQ